MNAPVVRLKDLCSLITKGTTPTSIGFDFSDDGVGFLRVQNVSGGSVNFKNETLFITENVHKELRRSQILPGDILLSIAGTIGRTGVVPENSPALNCNQALAIVRTEEKVFRPFLRHWLESANAQSQMRGATVTGTIQNLSLAQVGGLQVPLPSLPEQRRIAAILDQADALRAKRRETLAQLDSLTQSILLDLLKNEKNIQSQTLANIVQEMHQGINTVTEEIEYQDSGFPIIQSKHITQGYLDVSDARFVNESTFKKYKENYRPDTGDVLLCNIGTIGKSLLIHDNPPDFLIAWNLFLIKFRRNMVEPCYCKCYLDYLFLSHYFDQFMTGGTVKFISKKTFSATPIQLPSVESQREFVAKISSLEAMKNVHQKSLSGLDTLFSNLQHRAFRGEL